MGIDRSTPLSPIASAMLCYVYSQYCECELENNRQNCSYSSLSNDVYASSSSSVCWQDYSSWHRSCSLGQLLARLMTRVIRRKAMRRCRPRDGFRGRTHGPRTSLSGRRYCSSRGNAFQRYYSAAAATSDSCSFIALRRFCTHMQIWRASPPCEHIQRAIVLRRRRENVYNNNPFSLYWSEMRDWSSNCCHWLKHCSFSVCTLNLDRVILRRQTEAVSGNCVHFVAEFVTNFMSMLKNCKCSGVSQKNRQTYNNMQMHGQTAAATCDPPGL